MSSFSPIRAEMNRCRVLGAQLKNRPTVAAAWSNVLNIIREMGLIEVDSFEAFEDSQLSDEDIATRNKWLEETKRRVALVFEAAAAPGKKKGAKASK